VEGQPTGDGRMIEPGALRWDTQANGPMPIRYAPEDLGAHEGAQVVGTIDSIQRLSDGRIWAEGTFDTGSPIGNEAMRQVYENLTTGISMDLDEIAFEYRVSAELAAEQQAMMDELFAMVPSGAEDDEDENPGPPGGQQTDADGRVTVMSVSPDDEMEVTTGAQIRAATIVAIPAFIGARIGRYQPVPGQQEPAGTAGNPDPDHDGDDDRPGSENDPDRAPASAPAHALAAAAAPADRDAPPAAWFTDPHFAEPTAITVGADGRVRGHIAEWGTCHTGYADQCVSPPQSATGYAYFRTGSVLTREGSEVAVGRITMDTKHAEGSAGALPAIRHYDHTGTAVADVAAGEDEFGIWVAGALRPGLSAAQVRTLRSSPLSGDWRRIGGNLELVAALAVNVPGFPIPRTSGLVASGRLTTLLAAGMVPPRQVLPPGAPGALPVEDLRYLKRLIERDKRERASAAAAFASTVRTSQSAARKAQLARMAKVIRAAGPPQEGAPLPDGPAGPPYEGDKPDSKPDMSGPSDASWIMDDGQALAVACNSALDEAVGQLRGISTDGLPEPVAQAIGLMNAAWAAAHMMLPALGVKDPDATPVGQHASQVMAAFSRAFAEVDDSPWDGGAAMDSCHSASDFRSVCAGERKGDGTPDEKQHWALPHHSHPGAPPNAHGVANALARVNQTDGIDQAAARSHLEAHEKSIHPADKKDGKK